EGPRVVRDAVSLRDLPATVVHLLGVDSGSPFPGASLAERWRADGPRPGPAPVLSEVAHLAHAVPVPHVPATRGEVKALAAGGKVYIRNGGGAEELSALERDPHETRTLAGSPGHGESLEQLRSMLAATVGASDPPQRPQNRP